MTATVSFTVPQAIAIAERHRARQPRAPRARGIAPGKCFAVIMIGRLDDYLREVAHDGQVRSANRTSARPGWPSPSARTRSTRSAGTRPVLLVAALRGTYHLTELAGADLLMSIHPAYQEPFVSEDFPREQRIERAGPRTWSSAFSRCPTSSARTSRTA